MTDLLHPAAPHNLPPYVTAPGETDVLMVVMAVFLVLVVLAVGLLFLRLHTLPERMAHRSQKIQFEVVAVLGLLALFTHMHIFWVAGLLLAVIDIPDFGGPLGRMAGSLERIAGVEPGMGGGLRNEAGAAVDRGEVATGGPAAQASGAIVRVSSPEGSEKVRIRPEEEKDLSHA